MVYCKYVFMVYLEDTLEPCHELTIYGMQSYMHILAVIACEALDKAETFKDNKPYHQIFNYLSLRQLNNHSSLQAFQAL